MWPPSPWFHSRLPDDGFIVGHVSGDVFDDPPGKKGVFAPKKPPPFFPEHGHPPSPTPYRKGCGPLTEWFRRNYQGAESDGCEESGSMSGDSSDAGDDSDDVGNETDAGVETGAEAGDECSSEAGTDISSDVEDGDKEGREGANKVLRFSPLPSTFYGALSSYLRPSDKTTGDLSPTHCPPLPARRTVTKQRPTPTPDMETGDLHQVPAGDEVLPLFAPPINILARPLPACRNLSWLSPHAHEEEEASGDSTEAEMETDDDAESEQGEADMDTEMEETEDEESDVADSADQKQCEEQRQEVVYPLFAPPVDILRRPVLHPRRR